MSSTNLMALPVTRAEVNPHLGDFALDRLPIPEASSFSLPQTSSDADLRSLVLQIVEPRDELFGLADDEHAENVATRIQVVKRSWVTWTPWPPPARP